MTKAMAFSALHNGHGTLTVMTVKSYFFQCNYAWEKMAVSGLHRKICILKSVRNLFLGLEFLQNNNAFSIRKYLGLLVWGGGGREGDRCTILTDTFEGKQSTWCPLFILISMVYWFRPVSTYIAQCISIKTIIVHFFSSVAHVWVLGSKTTGPIAKKFS
jgi:hypothetical protein